MVYYFDDFDKLNDSFMQKALDIIPKERAIKADRYRHIRDKHLCVISYLLLLYGLKSEDKTISDFEFQYNNFGKPYFNKSINIYFNISHCRCGVACGISSNELGVDIQDIVKADDAVLNRVCSLEELKYIKSSSNPDKDFTKLWTYKESCLKAKGMGISDDLKKVNFTHSTNLVYHGDLVGTTIIEANYIITVCSYESIKCSKVTWEDIQGFVNLFNFPYV